MIVLIYFKGICQIDTQLDQTVKQLDQTVTFKM